MKTGDKVRIARAPFWALDRNGLPDTFSWRSDLWGEINFKTEIINSSVSRSEVALSDVPDLVRIKGPLGNLIYISKSCLEPYIERKSLFNVGDEVRIAKKPFFMVDENNFPVDSWYAGYGNIGFETIVLELPDWTNKCKSLAHDVVGICAPHDVVVISASCLEKI